MEEVRRLRFRLELTGDMATGKSTALREVIVPALLKAGYTCEWRLNAPEDHIVLVTAPLTRDHEAKR